MSSALLVTTLLFNWHWFAFSWPILLIAFDWARCWLVGWLAGCGYTPFAVVEFAFALAWIFLDCLFETGERWTRKEVDKGECVKREEGIGVRL